MSRTVLLFIIGLLLTSHIEAQSKRKSKSKFKALLPAFEPTKPKTNSIAEKPANTASASSASTIEAVGTVDLGKTPATEPKAAPKEVIPQEPYQQSAKEPSSKPVAKNNSPAPFKQIPSTVKESKPVKKNVKASPYSLFLTEKPKETKPKSLEKKLQLPSQNEKTVPSVPAWDYVPPNSRQHSSNFFGQMPTPTTPAPTTPQPPTPAQQSLFGFLHGRKPATQTQQVLPFNVPSMPPYPGLPNNNPQLNNVYRMIATWLVSHAMKGGNNAAQPSAPATNNIPQQQNMRRHNQQRPKNQRQKNTLTPPPAKPARNPQKQQARPKKTNRKEEERLRKMREKAYREYMDEVYDIDVPDNAFANGVPPYNQGPPFGFPW